ncbi:hypothetical protein [Paenibacillus sp. H1-7]|nr:hypothetical protein [Paenibacillus sp. H1-7]
MESSPAGAGGFFFWGTSAAGKQGETHAMPLEQAKASLGEPEVFAILPEV